MSATTVPLHQFLENIEDPRRQASCDYKLTDILFIAICAMLCNAETWEDMAEFAEDKADWLRNFVKFPDDRTPSHDTFYRIFSLICPEQFQHCFTRWVSASFADKFCGSELPCIAPDGKVIKGSGNRQNNPVCLVSAWCTGLNLVLAQKKVDGKSNEIKAVPELLEALVLKGCLVTADAMHCQKKMAHACIRSGAHYLLAVKGNQKKLHAGIQAYVEKHWSNERTTPLSDYFHEEKSTAHGRTEYRACRVFDEVEALSVCAQWEGIAQFGVVQYDRTINGNVTTALRFYITSKSMTAREMLDATRNHWSIENGLHWQLDVSFGEDACQTTQATAAENLSTIRRICLNILKKEGSKGSLKRKRKRAGWNNDFLDQLLTTFWQIAHA